MRVDRALHSFHGKRHPREMGEAEVGTFDSLVAHSLGLSARPVYVAATSLLHSHRSGARGKRRRLDPESGAERPAFLIQGGAEGRDRLAGGSRAGKETQATSHGFAPR